MKSSLNDAMVYDNWQKKKKIFWKHIVPSRRKKKAPKKSFSQTNENNPLINYQVMNHTKFMVAVLSSKMNAKGKMKRQISVVVIWPPWDSTVQCRWLFAYFTPSLSEQCIFGETSFFFFSLAETKTALRAAWTKVVLIKINSIINKII